MGISMLLACFLWVNTYASTSKVQICVSKDALASLLQADCFKVLFAQQLEDSLRVEILDSIKLKDPNKALLYAVIPGIVVHGAGHFYAGKTKTGAILLASGLVGGTVFVVRGVGESLSHLNGGEANSEAGYILIATGAALFLGTWIYDIIGAPLAVQKYNEELLRKKTVSLKFDFDETTTSLRFQIVKRF